MSAQWRSAPQTLLLLAPAVVTGGWLAVLTPAPATVTVITSSSVEAYQQALDGVGSSLGGASVAVRVVDVSAIGGKAPAPPSRLLITIGADALDALAPVENTPPVICTMMLKSDLAHRTAAGQRRPASAVYLDVGFDAVLAQLADVFPGRARIGIIRNPQGDHPLAADLQAQASRLGFTVRIVECSHPADLVRALIALKGSVDFVWCLPDASLYDGTTLKPVIMASLSNGLPLIGFSYSFVRAGAAIGVFPDFREVGVQTGNIARLMLAGQPVPAQEGPRKVKVAVNQPVTRLLGLQFRPPRGADNFSVLR